MTSNRRQAIICTNNDFIYWSTFPSLGSTLSAWNNCRETRIESTKTTSMEDVCTGVLEKIKNIEGVKIKPKIIWCNETYIIAYVKIQKNEDILSSMSNPQPNWCLKIDFQKVDQHAGGKWLLHDTRRRTDNQLQSLKLPNVYFNFRKFSGN